MMSAMTCPCVLRWTRDDSGRLSYLKEPNWTACFPPASDVSTSMPWHSRVYASTMLLCAINETHSFEMIVRVPRSEQACRLLGVWDSVRLHEGGIRGVRYGMSMKEVEALHGKFLQFAYPQSPGQVWSYAAFIVTFGFDGRVSSVSETAESKSCARCSCPLVMWVCATPEVADWLSGASTATSRRSLEYPYPSQNDDLFLWGDTTGAELNYTDSAFRLSECVVEPAANPADHPFTLTGCAQLRSVTCRVIRGATFRGDVARGAKRR